MGEVSPSDWWRNAVIYQIYPRSFADGDGDGTGDLAGARSRLPYLRDLGVDAVWFTPWYRSPLADGGYDIADYRDIDPAFGSLAEAEDFIREADALGIATIIDIVPNHVSDQHPWFQAALAAGPGSPERERFWFHPGRGEDGSGVPTHWESRFQGGTWTRTTNPDGTPGEWYLHLFAPEQPDLNWNHPEVRAEFESVLRFWFDRGVAGVRIDSAAVIMKDPALPEAPADHETGVPAEHPFLDRDEVHEVYRSWRAIADSYPTPRALVGEVWLPELHRVANYLRADELHTAFNFDFMSRPWQADELRASIETTFAANAEVGAPNTWALSNHDVTRPVTRYGRQESGFAFLAKRFGTPTDLPLGLRRARAACLLTAALPGCLYIYQGDELGLPEHEDLPLEMIQDPMHFRSAGLDPGRDGCRVPLPWSSDPDTAFGFSTPTRADGTDAGGQPGAVVITAQPWLPQPQWWGDFAVDRQVDDPSSMLSLYRRALAVRRERSGLATDDFAWWDLGPEVLAFTRGDTACVVNFGATPLRLPESAEVLLVSAPLADQRTLGSDTAAWLAWPVAQ